MVGFENGKVNIKLLVNAVLCGGTANPELLQSIVSAGTTGQILTSTGASSLPTMQDAPEIGGWTTFTPTIRGSTTAGSATYVLVSGKYIVIGTTCYVSGYISWSSTSGQVGNPSIGSLPFTIKNTVSNNIPFAVQSESWGTGDPASAVTSIGNDFAVLYANNGSLSSSDTSATIQFTGFYEVA